MEMLFTLFDVSFFTLANAHQRWRKYSGCENTVVQAKVVAQCYLAKVCEYYQETVFKVVHNTNH